MLNANQKITATRVHEVNHENLNKALQKAQGTFEVY